MAIAPERSSAVPDESADPRAMGLGDDENGLVSAQGTVPAEVVSSEAAPSPGSSGTDRAPCLAEGIELIGEFGGSGFKEPPSLVRRSDGQVIQLPPLLYQVAAKADGSRTYAEIGREVSGEIRRVLDEESVRYLAEEKLRPLGILAATDGSSPHLPHSDPFLALKFKAGVVPAWLSNSLSAAFTPLFFPLIVLGVVGSFVVTDWWLFGIHGVAQSLRQAMYNPGLFLLLFGAIVLSAAFHEIGHGAGCRYGGGKPGKMGCGLYLAWPAFYTDVTDAYRLGKGGRLRTDLGGVYFNIIIVVATMGAYLVTRFEPLLLLIVVQHLEIAHQLLPVVRLDGYYIVSDLTGVPDLFSRIGPILRSAVPGRPADERVKVLKPWVRVAVTAWVLVVVPLLLVELFLVLLHLPRIFATAWDSAQKSFDSLTGAFGDGNVLGGLSSVLQLVALSIPIIGIALVLSKSAQGAGRWLITHTRGRPVRRGLTLATVILAGTALVYSWVSPDNYTPIRPDERGTITESVKVVRRLPDLPVIRSERPSTSTTTSTPAATTTTIDEGSRETGQPAVTPTTIDEGRTSTTEVTDTTVSPSTTSVRSRATTTSAP